MRYISKTKLYYYVLTFFIIFQDSIKEITHLSIIDYFDEILILYFVMRALIRVFNQKEIPTLSGKLLVLTFTFWLIGIFSCLQNSSYQTFDLIMGSILMIKIHLLIISLIVSPLSEKQFTYFVDALLFIGKICLLTGIINFVFPKVWTTVIPYAYEYRRSGFPSVMGLFIHAGQYGWFMLLISIIYYVYYKETGNKVHLYKFVIYALAACMSMKVKVFVSIICIIAFDAFILQQKKISSNKIIISLIAIITVFCAFGSIIFDTYNMYFTDSTGSARFALLSGSLKILKDFFPIGVGFSKYGSYYPRIHYSEWYYEYGLNTVWGLRPGETFFGTDTFWPAIMGETGFLGIIVYVLLLYSIYHALKRIFDKTRDLENTEMIIPCLGLLVFIQTLVESTGEPIFNSSPQNIVIGLIIGSVLAIQYSIRGYSYDTE